MTSPFAALHFIGDAFHDLLFNYDSQNREHATAWKLTRSPPHLSGLASDWWSWVAIGIPLNLIDKSQPQGDIDLLIARPDPECLRKGETGSVPQQYRVFELKVGTINQSGEARSMKINKFERTLAQLKKLANFGAEQIFLLEAYIVQAGFSQRGVASLPPDLVNAISDRSSRLLGKRFGYVLQLIEQVDGYDEEKTGIAHPPINILPAPRVIAETPFASLAQHIDEYLKGCNARNKQTVRVVGYCLSCRSLTTPQSYEMPQCHLCRRDLIRH